MPENANDVVVIAPQPKEHDGGRQRLLAEIAACRADPIKMLMHQRPVTMAIMMALTRPASEVLDLAEEGFTTPAATEMSAIEALGIAAVGGALRGSTNAASFITERLEGRPGQRAGETSPESIAAREETQATIAEIVATMTAAKLKLAERKDRLPGEPMSEAESNQLPSQAVHCVTTTPNC